MRKLALSLVAAGLAMSAADLYAAGAETVVTSMPDLLAVLR